MILANLKILPTLAMVLELSWLEGIQKKTQPISMKKESSLFHLQVKNISGPRAVTLMASSTIKSQTTTSSMVREGGQMSKV